MASIRPTRRRWRAPARSDLLLSTLRGYVEAMGGHGEYCERPEEIRPALERSFASGKPALINVKIRKDVGGMKGSVYV